MALDAQTRTALLAVTDILSTLLADETPAKSVRKPVTRKAPAVRSTRKAPGKAATVPATKPASNRKSDKAISDLSGRKEWNRTLTAIARRKGGDAYARVIANWTRAQELRAEGKTPAQVLATITK